MACIKKAVAAAAMAVVASSAPAAAGPGCNYCSPHQPQSTTYTLRVSLTDADQQASAPSGSSFGNFDEPPPVSADGRYVAFSSMAALVPQDNNGKADVYVRDRVNGTTKLVSAAQGGNSANQDSTLASMSADGRYVAFESTATDLVLNEDAAGSQVYVRDLQLQTTERVADVPGCTVFPRISGDGRYVAFVTAAALVPSDTNGSWDVYVRDRQTLNAFDRVSAPFPGAFSEDPGLYSSMGLSISHDGRYVAFETDSSTIVAGDNNGTWDVFRRDRQSGTTVRVSVGPGNAEANNYSMYPSVSDDGNRVAFHSWATNLTAQNDATPDKSDVYMRDINAGTTQLVSIGMGAQWPNSYSAYPSISGDGTRVAFSSMSTNLVSSTNSGGFFHVYVRNLQAGTTIRASVNTSGEQAVGPSKKPAISDNLLFVAFVSYAANLVPSDGNGTYDVFLRRM